MTFNETLALISVAITLLALMIGGYVRLKTDIASISTKQDDHKEALEKWRLETSNVTNLLQRDKADKEMLNAIRNELTTQITQTRIDNTREHDELKKSLHNIEEYLRKRD